MMRRFSAHAENSRPAYILTFTIEGDLGENLAQTQRHIRNLSSKSVKSEPFLIEIKAENAACFRRVGNALVGQNATHYGREFATLLPHLAHIIKNE